MASTLWTTKFLRWSLDFQNYLITFAEHIQTFLIGNAKGFMHYAGIHISLGLATTKIMNAGFIFYKYYVISSMHLTEEPEKHDAQLRYESTRNAALAIEPDADIYTDIGLYKLLHEGISETQEKVMLEYIAARAIHEGIMFRNKVDRIKNSEKSPN